MITIGTVKFDFRADNEAFHRPLYSGWDTFFRHSFEAVADEVMSFYDVADEVLTIDSLTIDLGTIAEPDFYHLYPVRLREALHGYFRELLIHGDNHTLPGVSRVSTGQGAFDLLCFFLLHGYLPFYADSSMTDVGVLLDKTLRTEPYRFREFLECYAHYDFLHQRLASQFDGRQRKAIAKIARPSETKFAQLYDGTPPPPRHEEPQLNMTSYPAMNEQMKSRLDTGGIEIPNAGLVLLYRYYTHLFARLGLYEDDSVVFKDDRARVKAIFMLQYVAYGNSRTEFSEQELAFNRFLINYSGKPLPRTCRLKKAERQAIDSIFDDLKTHWTKVKMTGTDTIRTTFIQRKGILRKGAIDTMFELQVEPYVYDVLIDSIPWSYSMIRPMNSDNMLSIKWRNQ